MAWTGSSGVLNRRNAKPEAEADVPDAFIQSEKAQSGQGSTREEGACQVQRIQGSDQRL